MFVYCLTNQVNGKQYIGKTLKSLKKRIAQHFRTAQTRPDRTIIHQAIRKYGAENFTWAIVVTASSPEELEALEMQAIVEYNTMAPYGYNMTAGGEGWTGMRHTPATRALLAEKTRQQLASQGNPRSIPVTYNGVTYPHIKAAMDATGHDRKIFRRLLRNMPPPEHAARPLELDGVRYRSVKEARQQTGRSSWYIYTRLQDGRACYLDADNPGYHFSEEGKARSRHGRSLTPAYQARPMTYDGVDYPSIKAARLATGHTWKFFIARLRDGRAWYLDA